MNRRTLIASIAGALVALPFVGTALAAPGEYPRHWTEGPGDWKYDYYDSFRDDHFAPHDAPRQLVPHDEIGYGVIRPERGFIARLDHPERYDLGVPFEIEGHPYLAQVSLVGDDGWMEFDYL